MINLIPPEAKKEVRYEYLNRLVVVGGILLAGIVFINLILIAGLWFLLDTKGKAMESLVDKNQNTEEEKRFDDLVIVVDDLNRKTVLVNSLSEYTNLGPILDSILEDKIDGIKINNIHAKQIPESEMVEVILAGVFDHRSNFNNFIDKLKSKEGCSVVCADEVISPADNLIKDSAGPFTITVHINKITK